MSKKSIGKVPVLTTFTKGMTQFLTRTDHGRMVIRKKGSLYQVFHVDRNFLTFFGEKKVADGAKHFTIGNELMEYHVGTKYMIDGKTYTVTGSGGKADISIPS